MHSVNIVHRDLKLENILIDDEGESPSFKVKLIDFGFATICPKGKRLDLICGTPCYMDPELSNDYKYLG